MAPLFVLVHAQLPYVSQFWLLLQVLYPFDEE